MNKLSPGEERKVREYAKRSMDQLPTQAARLREMTRLKRLIAERDSKIKEWQKDIHHFDILIRTIKRLGRQK